MNETTWDGSGQGGGIHTTEFRFPPDGCSMIKTTGDHSRGVVHHKMGGCDLSLV